jgi:hypothetical protein
MTVFDGKGLYTEFGRGVAETVAPQMRQLLAGLLAAGVSVREAELILYHEVQDAAIVHILSREGETETASETEPCPCGEDTVEGCAWRPGRHCGAMTSEAETASAAPE